MKKSLFLLFTSLALIFSACRTETEQQDTVETGRISISVKSIGPDFAEMDTDSLPAVPYTVTHTDINPSGYFTFKAEVKDGSLAGKKVNARVSSPAEVSAQPITITPAGYNTFNIKCKKVDGSVTGKILFSVENTSVEREISFEILSEPSIVGIKCETNNFIFGKDFTYKLKNPTIICNPEKTQGLPSENFILNDSKKITYTSDDASVVTVDQDGKLTTHNDGDAVITLKSGSGASTNITVKVENAVAPETITLSSTSVNIKKDEQKEVMLTATPSGASLEFIKLNENNVWECTNWDVCHIWLKPETNDTYIIKGVKEGNAVFYTKSRHNPDIEIKINVTVSKETVSDIKIEPPSLTLEKWKTEQLSVNVLPIGAPKGVRWESSDGDKVSVNEDGLIEAKAEGIAFIKAISLADDTKVATCKVTVPASANDVTLEKTVLELEYGEKFTMKAHIDPPDASQEVIWSVDKGEILEYTSKGVITAKHKTGKAIVTATSKSDGSKKAECVVYVAPYKVASITANVSDSFTMDIDSEKMFTVSVAPSDATSDLAAEVEGTNLVLKKFENYYPYNEYRCVVKAGSAQETNKITFTSKANPSIKKVISITAQEPQVQSVTIKDKPKTIAENQTGEKMRASIFPANAEQRVTWESDAPSVVSVNPTTGELIPHGTGTATITATSVKDPTKKDTAEVTVKAVINNFSLSMDGTSVWWKKDRTLTVNPEPSDAFGEFEVTSTDPDLAFEPVIGSTIAFKVKVTNRKTKSRDATVTVKAKSMPSLAEKTQNVSIKTVIPTSISISGESKMYKDEVLKLTVNAHSGSWGEPYADNSVTWKIKDENSNFSITEDGKLSIRYKWYVNQGDTVTAEAISKLDESKKAEKTVTVYNNIANIKSVYCADAEFTLNTAQTEVSIAVEIPNYTDSMHNKIAVTEKRYLYNETPSSNILENSEYTLDVKKPKNVIKIKPKKNTSGGAITFYVFPIDPKTGYVITDDDSKNFKLTVWEKRKGIKILKPNGTECYKDSDGNYLIEVQRKASYPNFKICVTPEYAKPLSFNYSISGDTNIYDKSYTNIKDWKDYTGTEGGNIFTIYTEDIGALAGSEKHNLITFNYSIENQSLKQELYVTVKK